MQTPVGVAQSRVLIGVEFPDDAAIMKAVAAAEADLDNRKQPQGKARGKATNLAQNKEAIEEVIEAGVKADSTKEASISALAISHDEAVTKAAEEAEAKAAKKKDEAEKATQKLEADAKAKQRADADAKAATEAEEAVKAEEKAEADATAAKEQARAKATKKTQAEEKAEEKADADAKAATEAEDAKAKEKADNEKDTADAKEKAEATAAKEKMAATKAAKEKEKADAEEKLQKEEAAERNRALDNEAMKQSDLENMKAGAKHVGSNIYIPKDAVHFKDGRVSALFVQSNGDEGSLVHGPFKTSPAAGTIGVHVTVQFEKPVTVARCSICESSSLPAGYWAKEQQAPLCDNKSSLQCSLGDCSWWDTGGLRKSKDTRCGGCPRKRASKHQVWQFLNSTHNLARSIYINAEDSHQKKAHFEHLLDLKDKTNPTTADTTADTTVQGLSVKSP